MILGIPEPVDQRVQWEDGTDLFAHALTMRMPHGISNNDSAIPSAMSTTMTTAIQHLSWTFVYSI
jgi:hypothetical protein